jgi:glycerol-1-phosphate dehydrogenase [NAD(P)+]
VIEADRKQLIVDDKRCEALCDCGGKHTIPTVRVASGVDAYPVLAEDCTRAFSEGSVLLLDDENTHQAAGEAVLELLEKGSVACQPVTLPGDPVATEELAERICDLSAGHSLIIAVGAGTINDLGKYAGDKRAIPFWSVPTAPSMNGYTSSIVAIKVRGVKRTLPARPPQFIYVDPRVIENSPLELRQAGFCDVLAKSVSDFDWQTESLLFEGTYCSLPSAIVHEPESRYIDHPEKIPQGDREAVMGLFEGLLFSGVAMTLAGSSAPASGGEHLISHFLDMREILTGEKPNLHGLQVGVGVILSAACYRRLAALDESDLKGDAEVIFDADAARIPSVWGSLASEVEKQFGKKRDRLLQFDSELPIRWPQLKTLFSQVKPPEFFLDLFRQTGLEMTLPSLGISKDEFLLGAASARTIRDRITVLDISAHAGVLEAAAAEAVEMLT